MKADQVIFCFFNFLMGFRYMSVGERLTEKIGELATSNSDIITIILFSKILKF